MKVLIIDTETNGLPKKYGADPKDFNLFPEILSIAWCLWDTETGETESQYFVINREIETFSKHAMEVNGFDQERLRNEGVEWTYMIEYLRISLHYTDLIACHNTGFDLPILQADLYRNGQEILVSSKPTLCTMKSTTEICKIPSPRGKGYKWPKLEELYHFLFEREMACDFKAHNAEEDVKATFLCLKALVDRRLIDLGNFAKKAPSQ